MRSPTRPYVGLQILQTTPSVAWLEMADDLLSVRFSRGNGVGGVLDTLQIGDLSITLDGNNWSPATNPVVRPGARIRAQGRDASGTMRDLWYGRVGVPTTTYTDGKPVTVLPALDVMGIASANWPTGKLVHGTLNARMGQACLTMAGAPSIGRTLVGSDDTYSGSTFAVSADGSILDRWTIVRNSRRAWLWASRAAYSTVMMRSSASPPPTSGPVLTFSDSYVDAGATVHHYTDAVISHDAEEFITGVKLNYLVTAQSYGPFSDDQAVAAGWPRRDEEVTVTDRSAVASTDARDYLRRRPLPAVIVRSVTIDALRNRSVFTDDLIYQPVRVKHAQTGINTICHIIREEHRVTPDSWFITYELRPLDAFRTITVTDESPAP